MAELVITTSDGVTRTVTLSGEILLGRDPTCEVRLEDLGTSRRHARIRPEGDGYVVEDLGSKNGTLVNGVALPMARLCDGDEIMLGSAQLVFRAGRGRDDVSTSVVLSDQPPPPKSTRFSAGGERLALPQRRLEMLYDLSERLTRLRDRNELLEDVLNICFETLQFERGAIAVKPVDGRGLDWPVVRNLRGAGGELTVSRSVLMRALEHGERAVITDSDRADADPTVSMVQLGIRSALCVPLQHEDQILGVIYGDRTSTGAVYTEEDLDFLSGLARQVSIGLINSRLMAEQEAKLRLEHEISLARDIQRQLFPATLPDRPEVRVAALNDPGRHVSGDYYDVLELSDGRVALVIADVTGEGVAASLLMANLQAAVRVTLPHSDDLGDLLGQWNRLIYDNTGPSKFVTAYVCIVDPKNRTLLLGNAGHPQPFILRPEGRRCEQLDLDAGLPLGVVADHEYTSSLLTLDAGPCYLFCYTDGVIEAMNDAGALFGHDRLVEALEQAPPADPAGLISRLRRELTDFSGGAPQSDDITMLSLWLA
ncbi:MAG: SpoIIE family protein phosphatase [Planctomycetes bacterium]|nr:SpoIIE family protein phosphatase [Planctomycetota bacterium]